MALSHRTYYCPAAMKPLVHLGSGTFEGENVRIQCGAISLEHGSQVPICDTHGIRLIKSRKTAAERSFEIRDRAFMWIGGQDLWLFKDNAKIGTARCRLCMQKIAKGDERIGFDWRMARAHKMPNGAVLSRQRYYVHRSCFVDVLFDGAPGRGCPGCTAKSAEREFQAYKKMLVNRSAT